MKESLLTRKLTNFAFASGEGTSMFVRSVSLALGFLSVVEGRRSQALHGTREAD